MIACDGVATSVFMALHLSVCGVCSDVFFETKSIGFLDQKTVWGDIPGLEVMHTVYLHHLQAKMVLQHVTTWVLDVFTEVFMI